VTVAPVANIMLPAGTPPVHEVVVFEQATTSPPTMVKPVAATVQLVAET
jgi:hypothetical protein